MQRAAAWLALGETLESAVPSYHNPRPRFATTFLDDDLRISRDQDGKLFVSSKVRMPG